MKLTDYLAKKDKRPSAFAADIGVPVSTVTRLLKGERAPGIALMAKIKEATGGKVTPNDFLPASEKAA